MAKILLVPGYATHLEVPIFRPRGLGADLGFTGFRALIKGGKAQVLDWGLKQKIEWFNILNPWAYHRAYRQEEAFMKTDGPLQALRQALLVEKPEVIVAHSMGARLVGRLLAREEFSFIKEVHLAMSDDGRWGPEFLGHMRVIHHYCSWDVTLWASSLIHAEWRAGLWPTPHKNRENKWLWLVRPFNLHTAPLRSPGFARKVAHIYAVRSPSS